MLTIRRSNCINIASGIVFSVSDILVCRCAGVQVCTGPSLTEYTIPDAVLIQFDFMMISTELLETCRGLQ